MSGNLHTPGYCKKCHESLESETSALKARCEEAEKADDENQKFIEERAAQIEDLQDDLCAERTTVVDLALKIKQLESDLAAAKKDLTTSQCLEVTYFEEMKTLTKQLSETQAKLEAAEKRLHPVQTLKTCRDSRCTGDSKVCGVCAELERLEEKLAAQEKVIERAKGIIEHLGLTYPDDKLCFCEMAIGNPMMQEHSLECEEARAFLDEVGKI